MPGIAFSEPAAMVVAQHVIEHVEDPRAFVKALASLTLPGGIIVVVTEDAWSAQSGWARLQAKARGSIPPFHTSTDHTFVFDGSHLRRMLREAGCDQVQTRSFCYRAGGESMHWRLYKSLMRGVNSLAGRGDYLMAVGRLRDM